MSVMEDHSTPNYVTDVDYPFNYYPNLNPLRLGFSLIRMGFDAPDFLSQQTTAMELGFGEGITLNVNAAANPMTTWYGNDFNLRQAKFADTMAKISHNGARIFSESFLELVNRADSLPDFDYIVLHGVWSWVTEQNRQEIVEFLKTKLKRRGIVYISYNTAFGMSSFSPVRHLLYQHYASLDENLTVRERIADSLSAMHRYIEQDKPLFIKQNPLSKIQFNSFCNEDYHYLAHEFFNKPWHLTYFDKVQKAMAKASLTFAGHASFIDNLDNFNFTDEQRETLANMQDLAFRENLKDFFLNTHLRDDLYVRELKTLLEPVRRSRLFEFKVILLYPRHYIDLMLRAPNGIHDLEKNIYLPLLDMLSEHKIISIGELYEALHHHMSFEILLEAITVLIHKGSLDFTLHQEQVAKIQKRTIPLNEFLLNRTTTDILASPVTGSGIYIDEPGRCILRALYALTQDNPETLPLSQLSQIIFEKVQQDKLNENLKLNKDKIRGYLKEFLPTFLRLKLTKR